MKILYGIQGTGNGHITRARHMAKALDKHPDIQVDYLFSGRSANNYFDMHDFTPYKTRQGFTFVSDGGQIRHIKTLLNNNIFRFFKDVSSLQVSDYDLLVNDFEPVTAWAAKKEGIPSLSISHQAAFLHGVPIREQSTIDKVITKYFAPTQYCLGTHWFHFGYPIIPPVVANDLLTMPDCRNPHTTAQAPVLVYLPFEYLLDIRIQLHVLSDIDFICYHPNISEIRQDKNISWRPLSKQNFKRDLHISSGVISNSGFELSTECLSLGKPLLVKPLRKQYEQISNAYTMEKLGLCQVLNTINAEDIDEWLNTRQGVQVDFPTNCDELVKWIKQGQWHATEKLCQHLWQQVRFPIQVQERLSTLSRAM